MRTKMTIVGIVLACFGAVIAVWTLAAVWFGWLGTAACALGTVAVLVAYVRSIAPWHARWGATDEEVERTMPGDGIIPIAASTTRSITIERPPELVWPWLVQIGYGRAGWYSYDWIDNDWKPSARRILPELQDLGLGDRIDMVPGFGPEVVEIAPPRYLVAGDPESGTWCLALYRTATGSRLVSRWRQAWKPDGLASRFFVALAGPGAFIMERRMLLGIKERAESSVPASPRPTPVMLAPLRIPELQDA